MSINLYCPINSTGYGIASTNILKALIPKTPLSFFAIGQPNVNSQEDYDLISSLLLKQENFDANATCLKIWHQFDLAERVGRGKYFAYPFFELDTFSDREKKHLSIPDGIFVSSQWAKDVISQNNIKTPTHIVPLGVNTNIFNQSLFEKPSHNKYVFLNIGKWEVRKGHDVLVDIFLKAFPNEEDVELWVVASEHTNSYSSKEQLQEWKNKYSVDKRIKISTGVSSQLELAHIISQASCGIFMSRAEGWNLELLECMAMNKPTIATNYTAHTEFCNKNNCYLVDIQEKEKAFDGKAFVGQGSWGKIGQKQIDECIDHMRFVYKNRIENNNEGLKTAQYFSWNNSADQILRCI